MTTQGSETAGGVVGTAILSDTATLSGGFMLAAGTPAPTLTFTFFVPNDSTASAETPLSLHDALPISTGTGTGSELATQVGLYYWNVSYNANGSPFDTNASHSGVNDTAEQETTIKAMPQLTTTATETGSVVGGGALNSEATTICGGMVVAAARP